MEYKKNRYISDILLVSVLFSIITVVFTYPLVFKIVRYIPGFHSTDEPFGALWNFWWLKYSWNNHVLSCPPIAFPFGVSPCESGYPLWNAINKCLSVFTGNIFAYNIQVLFGFILSALFAYYLVYYILRDKKAAFFSALIYAFCPYHFVRSWQHLGLSMTQWIPLYLLALLKLKDKPDLKNTFFAAISLFLVFSFDLYYAYFMFIATVIFGVFILGFGWKNKVKESTHFKNDLKVINKIFICGVIVFLLILPNLYLIFFKNKIKYTGAEVSAHNPYTRPFEDLFSQSAKPLGYLLPASTHPVLGSFTESFVGSKWYGGSFTEHTLYLGWVPLIFAFMAFRRWRKSRNFYIGFFIFLSVGAWLFSQPPWWNLFGLKIYMPSFFMYKILPMFRAYCRFGIVVMLAVAVLAGFGLKLFLERFKSHKIKLAVAALSCGLVLFEFWNYPPFKVIDVSKVPAVYYWLRSQPQDSVIAEYPLDHVAPNEIYKFYQTVHEKGIINGTIPGTHANRIANTISKLSDEHVPKVLKWMGVKYVLVHRDDYLNSELAEDKEDMEKVPQNPGLRLVRSFLPEECPDESVSCLRKTGPIDVYEIK